MNITLKNDTSKAEYQNIEMKSPNVADFLEAERMAGKVEGIGFLAALTSRICTFDGEKLSYEDVQMLPVPLFLELQQAFVADGLLGSEGPLSGSLPKAE